MKVLFISDHLEEVNGAGSLSRSHLKTLNELSGPENVYTINITEEKGTELRQDNTFTISPYNTKIGKLRNLLLLNHVRMNNSIIRKSISIIKSYSIDYVFIDESYFGTLVMSIKNQINIPIYAFYHDVKAVLFREWIKKERKRRMLEFAVGILNEKITQKYATYNITLNERENTNFFNAYGKNADFNLPIILKSHPNLYLNERNKLKLRLGFLGVYYYPNIQGITWFCEKVMPLIEDKADLLVAGRGMQVLEKTLMSFSKKIKVRGMVESLDEFYSSVDVIIAPIFEGAGMKVKTAEAFSYGKCFIGSKESLIGYKENIVNAGLEEYVYECNTSDDYISAINYLNEHLETNAISKIQEHFELLYSQSAAINLLRKYLI